MKITLVAFLMVFSMSAFADISQVETAKLVCVLESNGWDRHTALGCVSKVSIEKDTLEKEVLLLQKEKLVIELEKMKQVPQIVVKQKKK